MGSPRTPNGSQKKPVLGKVKSKAKKWMHLLHHKKKPQEDMQDPVQTAAAAMSTTMQTTDPQAQLDIPIPVCLPDFRILHALDNLQLNSVKISIIV
jgi:hypothetical protein